MATVSKSDKDKQKLIQDKCQLLLGLMLKDDDNKYCVDCDAKGPRWASWNIGIFLCIRCAGIHRNLGVHISRVKSVNLDSWTPEQVTSLQQMGNSRARAVYEANLPDNFRRPQEDSSLEVFIRAKYETKKYIAREWVPPPVVKVSWDAEIEADIKRKKDAKRKAAAGIVELPTPVTLTKSPVTNGSAVTPTSQEKASGLSSAPKPAPVTASKPSQDLLGLDNDGDKTDIFNGFLSAPVAVSSTATPSPCATQMPPSGTATSSGIMSLQAEQDSFFNQTSPVPLSSTGEKKPLDKDSILALYAKSSPAQSATPMYGMQGGMFANTTPTLGNGVASPAYISSPSLAPGIMQQAPYMTPQGGMGVGPNPFLPSAPMGLGYAQGGGDVTQGWSVDLPHSPLRGQMGGLSLGGMVPNATSVPSPAMQGVFAPPLAPGMVPGQQPQPALFASPGYAAPGHTLSNNLWQ